MKEVPGDPGFVLHVSDRTAAAMQLAAHFTSEAMRNSRSEDPRALLAEQLGYFDLAFRTIMGSTARGAIKASAPFGEDGDGVGARLRLGAERG
ncbi:MAG: hypothetical protein ACJ789_04805 [Thermomicrobiales bacterium]